MLIFSQLNQPFVFPHNTINPATLQTRIVRNNLGCILVAFGRNSIGTTTAVRQRQVQLSLSILDRDSCENTVSFANRLPERMLCTQTTATAAPCSGSLGSGLYCNRLLTGVLSGGNTCNANPAVYQQVRAFRHWIDATIAIPLSSIDN
jgi:trypsin